MVMDLLFNLRRAKIPVSITEYLAMLDGLTNGIGAYRVDDFYHFARLTLIKDEKHYDRFDQVFADYVNGIQNLFDDIIGEIPEEWLRAEAERLFSEEEKASVEALGGWDEIMETLKQRLQEQQKRHQGGNKWVGTGGTSPYGAYGFNPAGVRIGQKSGRQGRAVKVWDKREYKNLDDQRELGTRNFKMALRKLRRFARDGARDQLDLDGTISATAKNAGLLDIQMVAERRNAVKVLLLFDVGGSMDYHVQNSEALFSAARGEFKHLEYFYFHNFIYEKLWKDNRRRHDETLSTVEFLRTYGPDYRVIFIGDATMSPFEVTTAGGSVEHWNEESGSQWMSRVLDKFPHAVWLNPEPLAYWQRVPSIKLIHQLMSERMFPLTVEGIGNAITALQKKG
jgi:uncharacterized protein with von Willebrand factor type A (vWA) domain